VVFPPRVLVYASAHLRMVHAEAVPRGQSTGEEYDGRDLRRLFRQDATEFSSMSAKRFKLGKELRAKLDSEEQLREVDRQYRPNDFPAEPIQQEGRELIPRPDADAPAVGNDGAPAVFPSDVP
jgi:hypothetical protein